LKHLCRLTLLNLCSEVSLRRWDWIEQAPVDRVFPAKLVCSVDRNPVFRGFQVQHFNFADVRCASKFEQVAVVHDNESGGAGAVVEAWKHVPLVSDHVVVLARLSAFRPVPASHSNDVSIHPFCDSMGVSLVVHICLGLKAESFLVQHACLLEVGLSVGDGTPSHVNPASHLDTLLVPHRLKVVVLDLPHTFGPVEAVESDDVVSVE